MIYALTACVIFSTITYVAIAYTIIRSLPEGTPDMVDMAGIIRNGAKTFMKTEYKVISIAILVLVAIFSLYVEATSGLTFLLGAAMSSVACVVGMYSATYANVRTANKANETRSIAETVKVALLGGSISGLSVQALGTLGIILIIVIWGGTNPEATGTGLIGKTICNPSIIRLTTYSLGCSLVAMFNRVAGGNYTKAADISSDIIAKIRHDFPEDDSRVPNVIADFIGDNVNDIAGNCSDLLESYVATIAASLMIACTIFTNATANGAKITEATFSATCFYPIVLAGGGLLSCLLGIVLVVSRKMGKNPSKELNLATYISAGLTVLIGFLGAKYLFQNVELYDNFKFGWISPFVSAMIGIVSGVLIGTITEYYTSSDYSPTRKLAESAPKGTAFLVTIGDAIGSMSCLPVGAIIATAIIISGGICGTYGIVISALGMLSFVGTTVSIDAFGPIADNAGGIAESCHLDPEVRVITDKLDAVGNTTAAIGKGFAIGSAAFATVSLIFAFVGSYTTVGTEPNLNAAAYKVIAGCMFGAVLIEFFIAILTNNTIESAELMAEEGDRQLSIPGVIEGTVKPDYNKCIEMAANQALKKMLAPSILALFVPAIGGFLFGVEFIGGILLGATLVAICRAIFMGNSGGAFDNAKKYIESGALEGHGKGSAAHKSSVTGDTIGDTRKDVVGVSIDIFIKMMSTVANTLAPLIRSLALFR